MLASGEPDHSVVPEYSHVTILWKERECELSRCSISTYKPQAVWSILESARQRQPERHIVTQASQTGGRDPPATGATLPAVKKWSDESILL